MFGRITYTTTIASTPLNLFLTADFTVIADVFADTLPAGSTQDIYLKWGYSHIDPYHTDMRNVSQSASGVVEVINFLSTRGYKIGLPYVYQERVYPANEYAVLEALNYELMDGTPVTWYPDWIAYPTEYFSVISEKRVDQRRMNMLLYWEFNFDFMVLANVQIPSTVPDFVL